MSKTITSLLLIGLSLVFVACGGTDINKSEKLDQKELSIQGQVCPAGKYDDSMLRCSVKTEPVKLLIPVPEGWSAYLFGWDQEESIGGASQQGAASMVQDKSANNCHVAIRGRITGSSRKPMTLERVNAHNAKRPKDSKIGVWHFGDTALPDGTSWIWVDTGAGLAIFATTPRSDGTVLEWGLNNSDIPFKDGEPQGDYCSTNTSASSILPTLISLLANTKIS